MKSTAKISPYDGATLPPHNDFPRATGFGRAVPVAAFLGVSKSTLWAWVKQGQVRGVKVPQPLKLSQGVTVWRWPEIHEFYKQLSALTESAGGV